MTSLMMIVLITLITSSSASIDQHASAEVPITEEEMRREMLRLEEQRILEKLRLERAPENIRVNLSDLPMPVTIRVIEENHEFDENTSIDQGNYDSPGRLKSIYIIGEKPRKGKGRTHICNDRNSRAAICMEFELKGGVIVTNHLLHALLWLNLQSGTVTSVRLSIASVHNHGHEERIIENVHGTTTVDGQWLAVNMTEFVRGEMSRHQNHSHKITLSVTCDQCADAPPIAFTQRGIRRPFLDLQTRRDQQVQIEKRRKRSRLCGPSSSQSGDCCMEKIHVNFTEIGWNSWILQPAGYDTGYCKGRCRNTATRSYNSVMRALRNRKLQQQQLRPSTCESEEELAPCCSPGRMLPLTILYTKVENNHQHLQTAVLPYMIVDSCTC